MAGPAIRAVLHLIFLVAIQAPSHLHRRQSLHTVHGFNRTVTGLTFQPGGDMPIMRKMDKIRQVVHFDPGDGLLVIEVVQYFLDLAPIGGHFIVTANAFINAGHASRNRPPGLYMAVHARNFVISGVNLVAEIDRLFGRIIWIEGDTHPITGQQATERGEDDQTYRLEYF